MEKLPKEIVERIKKENEDEILNTRYKMDEMHCEFCKWYKGGICTEEEPIKKNPQDYCAVWSKIEGSAELLEVYRNIVDGLKDYSDLEEKYYSVCAVFIIGTYFHKFFPTFPYLYFNAMKGSGKSRIMGLITYLSKEGSMLNSLTEAVLFRTTGTLGIDEFEGITRKGSEALSELLNSAYKKGVKVKRMKKVKNIEGEEMVVEEFDVYRPIVMANINGMTDVLGDRCIPIILERSNNQKITKMMEIYNIDTNLQKIKKFPFIECRKCRVDVVENIYRKWNNYVKNANNTDTIHTTHTQHTINTIDTHSKYIKEVEDEDTIFFKKIDFSGISGRSLEITLPLLLIASWISEEVFEELLKTFKEIIEEKKKDEMDESLDVSLIDYCSQEQEGKWIVLKELFSKFSSSVNVEEKWFNEQWLGRALKRLNLIKDKKRMNYGRLVLINVQKAQEKIKQFK